MDNLNDLFTNTDYEIQPFEYKEIKEEIKCLKSSCTDFDLTGQIIWEAAIQLAELIIDNQGKFISQEMYYNLEDFKNKIVLELGAGAGLTGIVSANFAKNVILTDNNELVVDLLQLNKEFSKKDNIQVELFEWGEAQAKDLITKCGQVDYLIGSEILHWPASIKPLAETCRAYFDAFPKLQILIAIQKRSLYTIETFEKELERLNLKKDLVQNIGLVFIYKIENK